MWVVGLALMLGNPPPWQVAQPVVMPLWFMVVGTKAVVLVWQVSHLPLVGKCADDLAFTPVVTPWQVAQLVVMPVWFIAVGLNAAVDLWQVSQVAVVGM